MKKKIITWHGEGKSLFYIVSYDENYPLDYSILGTFQDREKAEKALSLGAA